MNVHLTITRHGITGLPWDEKTEIDDRDAVDFCVIVDVNKDYSANTYGTTLYDVIHHDRICFERKVKIDLTDSEMQLVTQIAKQLSWP